MNQYEVLRSDFKSDHIHSLFFGHTLYFHRHIRLNHQSYLLSCGIERIILGTGYKKEAYEALQADFPQIETCFSPRYADTNSMYTLYNTRDVIGDDSFLLLESDLVFERKAILSLLDDEFPDVMLVSSLTKFQDQYYVEYDRNHILTSCSVDKDALEAKGELVGIHKLSNTFYRRMCADYATILESQPKLGYEYELLRMSRSVSPVRVLRVEGLKWYEIDDEADLSYAEEHIIRYC